MKRKPGKLKKEEFIGGRDMTPLRAERITTNNIKSSTLYVSKKDVQPSKWPKNIDCGRSKFNCTAYLNMARRLQLCLEL
jgi:hypothetical protein